MEDVKVEDDDEDDDDLFKSARGLEPEPAKVRDDAGGDAAGQRGDGEVIDLMEDENPFQVRLYFVVGKIMWLLSMNATTIWGIVDIMLYVTATKYSWIRPSSQPNTSRICYQAPKDSAFPSYLLHDIVSNFDIIDEMLHDLLPFGRSKGDREMMHSEELFLH